MAGGSKGRRGGASRGGGKAKSRLSDYGDTQAQITRLSRNRNATKKDGSAMKASQILSASNVFNRARQRGYAKQEAATLAKQVAKANREGNFSRASRLTQGIYSEFRGG